MTKYSLVKEKQEKEKPITNEYVKRYLNLLIIQGIQIQKAWDYHFPTNKLEKLTFDKM